MKKLIINALQIYDKDDGMGKYATSIIEIAEKSWFSETDVFYILTNEGRAKLSHLITNKERIIDFEYSKYSNPIRKLFMENIVVPRTLSKYKADYYWSLDGKLPLFGIKNCVRILTIHDLGYIDVPKCYSMVQRLYWSIIYRTKARTAELVIAISEFTRQRAIESLKIKPEKIYVIYNFVRESLYDKECFVENNETEDYFLYYGQIAPRKNITGLLRAYVEYYKKSSSPMNLVLVGKKYEYEELDKFVSETNVRELIDNKISFVGYVNDEQLKNYIIKAKFIVNASLYEGFGMPIIEAFEFGKAILASNNTAMVEFINNYEKYTFDPYDVQDMTERIKYFSELENHDLKEIFVDESKYYREKINKDIIRENYKELLANVVDIK